MASLSLSPALTLEPLASDKTPLVDLRSAEDFSAGHLPNATNIPWPQLELAWHELLPKGTKLDLVTDSQNLAEVTALFNDQKYSINRVINFDQVTTNNLVTGSKSQRLWRANPLLEEFISLIKQHFIGDKLKALDIGCGSGRDSLFLTLHGFKVLALDYNPYALQRLEQFRQRWNADLATRQMDFQNDREQLKSLLSDKRPQLVVQARYLHRPLLDDYEKHLASGSLIAIHTFLEGAAEFGKPKNPAYLLNNGELKERYSNWTILLDQEHKLADGRPLSLFLAQKP